MNLLKMLFGEDTSEVAYFEDTLPLVVNLFDGDSVGFESTYATVAIAADAILPGKIGHVKFRGSRWRAYCPSAVKIPTGTPVRVIGRHRSTILLVEPETTSALPQR